MDVSMVGVSEASLVVIRREEHARLGGGGAPPYYSLRVAGYHGQGTEIVEDVCDVIWDGMCILFLEDAQKWQCR